MTAQQHHPYDPELSYHLANLALAAQGQPLWEADEPDHPDLEDLFAIPPRYYEQLFLTEAYDSAAIFEDVQGYIRQHYDLIGAIRIGDVVTSDYDNLNGGWAIKDVENMGQLFVMVQGQAQRLTETVSNAVRYSISRLLMGYALRSKHENHSIIVVRGTVSVGEWLNNLNYRLTPYHPHDAALGKVHNGFRDVYKGIRGRYRQLIDELEPDAELYLVGHSLGGAISQLAALDIARQHPEKANQVHVYAYAAPRVGDPVFVEAYNRMVGTSYRIVNVCDVVPYMPFDKLGTYLELENFPYVSTKGELLYLHQTGNPIDNHVGSYHLAMRENIVTPADEQRLQSPRGVL